MQQLVGGFVQRVPWGKYTLYVDEDGLLKQLMPSWFGGLVGTVIVTRYRGSKHVGLDANDLEVLLKPFR